MIATFSLIAAVQMAAAEPEATIQLYTEHNPPYTFEVGGEGDIYGLLMTMVDEMFRRANLEYQIELLPWNRAFSLTQRTPTACLFGMDRTPERETLFQWVTPLYEGRWLFFRTAESTIALDSLADLSPYRVAVTAGYASANALAATGHTKTLLAQSNADAMRLLYHGRVDLLLLGDYEMATVAAEAGLPEPVPVLKLGDTKLSMGCSLSTDPALVERLRQANNGMADYRSQILNLED